MKAILMLTLVIAVIVLTAIGCLMIVDVLSVEAGNSLAFKSLAAILVLGAASALIALLIRNRNTPER